MGAPLLQDPWDGLEKDGEISYQTPPLDIVLLQPRHVFEVGNLVAPRDLPRPRIGRLHVEPRVMMALIKSDLARQRALSPGGPW